MAITSILELQFLPEKRDEALAVLTEALKDTRAFDGCEGVHVVADASDPNRVAAVETWASVEQDTAYRQWRAGEGAITALPGFLAGPPRLLVGIPLGGA